MTVYSFLCFFILLSFLLYYISCFKFFGLGINPSGIAAGKQGEEISEYDYKGKKIPQKFSKSQQRQVLAPDELQNITEDDVIPIPEATSYVNSSTDILNKTN